MRTKIALLLVIAFALIAAASADNPKQDAKVRIVNGYYVFALCRPVQPYRHLSTVTMVTDSMPSNRLAYLLTFVKDSVPAAHGIVIPNLNFDTAFIIQFK